MKHFAQTKAQRQADWLAEFADGVVTTAPALAGRIDWPTAKHFYFEGMSVAEAVARYLEGRS
jgi:hypothetical protein